MVEKGGGLYCAAASWQMKRAAICRKHLSPLSSPLIMDTKQISFKERPDVVTLYLIVGFINPRKSNTFQFILMSVLCTEWGCSESSAHARVLLREIVLNSVQCAFYFSYFQTLNRTSISG